MLVDYVRLVCLCCASIGAIQESYLTRQCCDAFKMWWGLKGQFYCKSFAKCASERIYTID